ncbi:MAG: SWIM zinc finger family protein [Acidobacteriia bacterium]|nr:SWIM zinc finger family protein [Terriglobia bacterium]
MGYYGFGWKPYVTVAERRRKAAREMEKRKKQGHAVSPVSIPDRIIARTFWGKAWCENLERYSDYANRLPRGRTYVRNGSVIDLQITTGAIHAYVSGSELYQVALEVAPVAKAKWKSICNDCAGGIDSLVELLQGRLSEGVMERICRQGHGLFPSPAEIRLSCSCPDWADMCKHVAAVLYGIGARFDHQPELLFRLRAVDEKDLIVHVGKGTPLTKQGPAAGKVLGGEDLSELFGLDLAESGGAGKAVKAKRAKKVVLSRKGMSKPRVAAASTQGRRSAAGARKRVGREENNRTDS